jgi:hypothetical protein
MNSPPGKNKGNFYLKGSPAVYTQGRQGLPLANSGSLPLGQADSEKL